MLQAAPIQATHAEVSPSHAASHPQRPSAVGRVVFWFALALVSLILIATAFAAEAPEATSQPVEVAAVDLSGQWSGSWLSCSTGHKGPLNACLVKQDESTYYAHFSGRFFRILPFNYSVRLHVDYVDGETVHLSGSQFLGRIFGTFHFRATATPADFVAHYHSNRDNGQFVMRRCGW